MVVYLECLYFQMIMSDCHVLRDLVGAACDGNGGGSFVIDNFEILHEYMMDVKLATNNNTLTMQESQKKRIIKRLSTLFEFLEDSFKRTFERQTPEDELPVVV